MLARMAMELLVVRAVLDLAVVKAVLLAENEAFEFDQYAWQHLVQAILEQQVGLAARLDAQIDVLSELVPTF